MPDYVGGFVVTAGIGEEAHAPSASPAPTTTTRSILVKALADRLAEAFAERMHERVRKRVLGLCARRDALERAN